jgi:hypothetical protein
MTEDTSDVSSRFAGLGGLALVGGVVCCMGLKPAGGAVLFGGVAATLGITTDQTTFVAGGVGGLLLGLALLGYRRSIDAPA